MLTKCLQPIMQSKSHVLHASTTFFARPNEAGVFHPYSMYGDTTLSQRTPTQGMTGPAKDLLFIQLSQN